ncbi:Hypothetical Protein FCC1311_003132 [Hondaea fermentalgiana]|uniref:Uncharacterized protein n=1 Tax=Hondaea fermentalgiana TaxID=2315210 RepID=A0A2R5G0P6_9STRA|nr:Hypothetical Protein FCC1311_003132 [Hondaea fermentalgiana]|eukprot:GBG24095.1 Hypothetical Protein FCC1311_003132 [Hondaea fermentalgiana]
MDGFVTSSAGKSVGGVTALRGAEACREAVDILKTYFVDSEEDIRKQVSIGTGVEADSAPDPSVVRSVLGCVDEDGHVQAASVCFERKIKAGISVVEIVWFASRDKGNGWGAKLFQGLVEAAKGVGTDAILTTSTNAALRFWLSRTNIRIADAILRNKDRAGVMDFPSHLGFRLSPAPTSTIMERFYASMLVRNRKGRIVGDFEGKPYFYCVNTSNHVWYVLNENIHIKSIVHKTRPDMTPQPSLSASASAPSALASVAGGELSKKAAKRRRQRAARAAARGGLPLPLRPVSMPFDPLSPLDVVDSLARQLDDEASLCTEGEGDEYPTPASTPSLPL